MEHGRGYVDVVLVWLMLCSCGSMLELSQSSGTLGRRIFFLMIYGLVINQFVVVELFCAGWTFHFGESARVALSLRRAMMIDYG